MAINFEDIIARMRAEQQKANAANEERYQGLLDTIRGLGDQVTGTYDEALSNLEGVGDAARMRVQQRGVRERGRAEQDLMTRGLGNTTIRESVLRGVADDEELQQQQIDESVSQQRSGLLQNRAGAEMNVGGMLANAIEGRNDIGPDLGMYAQLLQQAAAEQNERLNVAVGRGLPPGGPTISAGGGGGSGSWIDRARGQGGSVDPNANRVQITQQGNVQGSSGAHGGQVMSNPGQEAAASEVNLGVTRVPGATMYSNAGQNISKDAFLKLRSQNPNAAIAQQFG